MSYYITKSTKGDFDAVVSKVIEKLKDEGFGVLTEIDVANTLKQKLGVEMKRYRILGACNPGFAHKALSVEDKIGVMLPYTPLHRLLFEDFLKCGPLECLVMTSGNISQEPIAIDNDEARARLGVFLEIRRLKRRWPPLRFREKILETG